MKRITVYYFKDFKSADVYYIDTVLSEGIEDLRQNLTIDETNEYISELILKYNMSESDTIRKNYFDKEEFLIKSDKLTIKQHEELKGDN